MVTRKTQAQQVSPGHFTVFLWSKESCPQRRNESPENTRIPRHPSDKDNATTKTKPKCALKITNWSSLQQQ